MIDATKRAHKRKKKGFDTIFLPEMCKSASDYSGLSPKIIEQAVMAYLAVLNKAIKEQEIVNVPLIGSLGLVPGAIRGRWYGGAQPHSNVHLWVDYDLRAEAYYLPPNPSTIKDPAKAVQAKAGSGE